jgi:hypothetical protein
MFVKIEMEHPTLTVKRERLLGLPYEINPFAGFRKRFRSRIMEQGIQNFLASL